MQRVDPEMTIVAPKMVRAHNGGHKCSRTGEDLPPYTVSIDIVFGIRHTSLRPLGYPEIRKKVQEWCDENCTGRFWVGSKRTVHFFEEGDAMLFKLSFG